MRSSRRLERECVRNVELHWLLNKITPSFKTIADFRKDHAAAIVEVCRAFIQVCRKQSLYGGELVAIDGTKIEAVASRQKVLTPKLLERRMAELDAKIATYLSTMNEADRQEASAEAAPQDVAPLLAALRAKRDAVQAQAKALADEDITQTVIGESEARLMKSARHGHQVAYNAQSAVDAKHGLIAAFDLTNDCNDQRQLLPMAEAAKESLAVESLTVVADTGYSNGEQGQACSEAGITAVVPRPATVNPQNAELFTRDAFTYDATSDSWTCPAGETLTFASRYEQKTFYATKACRSCALKPKCTKGQSRKIVRHLYEDSREAMHRRASQDPTFMQRRRMLAEHPFGIIKRMMGYPRFLLRGLQKAKAELALMVLGFNLKRAVAIRGVKSILDDLHTSPATS